MGDSVECLSKMQVCKSWRYRHLVMCILLSMKSIVGLSMSGCGGNRIDWC